jgi:hypothetical protein
MFPQVKICEPTKMRPLKRERITGELERESGCWVMEFNMNPVL